MRSSADRAEALTLTPILTLTLTINPYPNPNHNPNQALTLTLTMPHIPCIRPSAVVTYGATRKVSHVNRL